jgi:outer membrane receptor for ferrienterochelin and colicins
MGRSTARKFGDNWMVYSGAAGVLALLAAAASGQTATAPESAATVPATQAETVPAVPPASLPTTSPKLSIDPQDANPSEPAPAKLPTSDVYNMSLEDLMNVQVTMNTLTSTDRYMTPAAVTHLDRSFIDQANARNLNDLLNIYVPDLEIAHHTFESTHLGMRGIIGDRDDKYLMLVNGRVMNDRMHYGALTERDLVLQGDLLDIDVVRGPGSATYGPGAVMGVISQTTYNGLTFQGNEVKVRQGFLDQFTSFEYKFGTKFNENTGLFLYAGVADVRGASAGNAPIIGGSNWTSPTYGTVTAGEPVPYPFTNMGAEYNNRPQIKLHAQYDNDGFTAWLRYTNGGQLLDQTDKTYAPGMWGNPNGFVPPFKAGVGYEQVTAFLGYNTPLTTDLSLDLSTSWDATDYERYYLFGYANSHQEQKWISTAILNWNGLENHKIAGGLEFGYYWFGMHSWMSPDRNIAGDNDKPWQTYMYSFFFEDQWNIAKDWTFFTSARLDKHQYTDVMFSPRLALVWTPTEQDALKFMASQSLRTNTEESMRANWLSGERSDPEKMNTLELRYERRETREFMLACSVFFNDLDVLGWNDTLKKMDKEGTYKTAGIELEAQYRTGSDTITFSHSYAKLVGQDMHANTFITSAGFGYGYDLNAWSDNVTKLTLHHQFDQHLSADGSVQVNWGYPGSKDYMLWHTTTNPGGLGDATNPASWNEPFGISALLNLGAAYKFDEHATLRLDAYNVLGWIDRSLNKTMVLGSLFEGAYRAQSPAIVISLDYRF